MSFLGETTGFVTEDEDGEKQAPKIEDIKAWNQFCEEHEHLKEAAVVSKRTEGDYPKKQYKHLRGIKSIDKDDAAYVGFNIDNLAYQYKSDKFLELLEKLSKIVETPFSFYHSGGDGQWPRLDADTVWRVAEKGKSLPNVYHITVYSDSIEVEKAEVKMTKFEESETVQFNED